MFRNVPGCSGMFRVLSTPKKNGDNRLLEKLFVLFSYMQSLTTTFSEKEKTSEAKFTKKRQNPDLDSKNGKQSYKQRKNVE